jgi:DNA/RNA-binding domain of Phe-tRNA-synthetase-like protein
MEIWGGMMLVHREREVLLIFEVAEDCRKLGLRVGAIVFHDLVVRSADPKLRAAIREEVERIRKQFPYQAALRASPAVAQFHHIHRAVGANPRRDSPSIARLPAGALKRADLPAINSLVDAYNLVSVRHFCSVGAHDLDRICPPVLLTRLTGTESFTPLGQAVPIRVNAGGFGYFDSAGRLLCWLDVVQADFSKVTEATRAALLIIEGTTAHDPAVLEQAFKDAVELVTRHCGGTAQIIETPGA